MKKLLAGLVIALFMFGVAGVANANLITNGDFSTLDLTGWTLTGGEYSQTSEGYFREYDNSGWAILSQDITTSSGLLYDISFDTKATYVREGNQFAWSIDGGALNAIAPTLSWVTNTGTFLGPGGSTNIAFYIATDPGTGTWYLDNVSVDTDETPTIPEPGTMLLLGSGLVGLVAVRKKFKK